MIQVLFVLEKKGSYKVTDRLGDHSVAGGLEVSVKRTLGVRE